MKKRKSFLTKMDNLQLIVAIDYCCELLDELYLNGIITEDNNLDSKTYIAKQLANFTIKTKKTKKDGKAN